MMDAGLMLAVCWDTQVFQEVDITDGKTGFQASGSSEKIT